MAGRINEVSGTYQGNVTAYAYGPAYFRNGALESQGLGDQVYEQACQNTLLQVTGVRAGSATTGSTGNCGSSGSGTTGDFLNLNIVYGTAGAPSC
jgi:hypothetical protein